MKSSPSFLGAGFTNLLQLLQKRIWEQKGLWWQQIKGRWGEVLSKYLSFFFLTAYWSLRGSKIVKKCKKERECDWFLYRRIYTGYVPNYLSTARIMCWINNWVAISQRRHRRDKILFDAGLWYWIHINITPHWSEWVDEFSFTWIAPTSPPSFWTFLPSFQFRHHYHHHHHRILTMATLSASHSNSPHNPTQSVT